MCHTQCCEQISPRRRGLKQESSLHRFSVGRECGMQAGASDPGPSWAAVWPQDRPAATLACAVAGRMGSLRAALAE